MVLPFETLPGVPDSTNVGTWITHLIAIGLVQSGIGDPVLPHEMAAYNRSADARVPMRSAVAAAADAFEAGIVVSGTIQPVGDLLDVTPGA